MPFIRAIGRWTLTALVVNAVIGSGIFGLPSELTRLLGRASPLAMVIAALAMAVPILCMAEVASQFSESGGPYLYIRTAFGRFPGMQIGWFHLLGGITGGAASATLFMAHMAVLVPWVARGWSRGLLLIVLISIPTVANYLGVRSGASLSNLLTVCKLLPLALIIALGLVRFSHHFDLLHVSDITTPSRDLWLTAVLLLVFSYAGSEDALVPTAEVKEPRRTVPFSLLAGMLVCMTLYALVQFVTVMVIGSSATDHPLTDTASMLMGRGGETFVAISVMLATYGYLSGAILNLPRLACSLASQGDFPQFFAKLHPRFNTPSMAIIFFSATAWLMAATGTFLWAAAVSGGATIFIYSGTCAALIRLRRKQPRAAALRIPGGHVLAVIGIVIMLTLLTNLSTREALVLGVTALLGTANWWWAKRREVQKQRASQVAIAAGTE